MSEISEDRNAEIKKALRELETNNSVRILFACESGSRAWGFESKDSDYDVRFLYVHQPDWYLSVDVESKRDVIELPIDDLLDVSGWDLRKALLLIQKTNPAILEWLGSPIVYSQISELAEELRDLAADFYSPIANAHHYLRMARKGAESVLNQQAVRLKKYFYVIRPLLAAKWIEHGMGIVPTEFQNLLIPELVSSELKSEIIELRELKFSSTEQDEIEPITIVDSFIENEIERLSNVDFPIPSTRGDIDKMNHFFRKWVRMK